MPKLIRVACASLIALVVMGITLTSTQASLLVYEGFSGYGTQSLSGLAVSANAVGLSGNYVTATANGISISSTGLTFGGGATTYAVSGGASTWALNGAGGVGVTLAMSTSSYVGTLYGSYLVNLGANPTTDAARAEVRFNASTTGVTGTSFYNSMAASTTLGQSAVKYNTAIITTPIAMVADTTYMVISKWTNVGGTGTGVGTMWVLSSAQYDTLMTAGHLTDSYLSTAVVGTDVTEMVTSVSDTANPTTLANGEAMQLIFGSGSALTTRTIDEIKFGSSLLDVAAVPEPNSMALLLGSSAVLILVAYRRRSQIAW